MDRYEPTLSFDAASARVHDHRGDEAESVAFLERVANGGRVLELAIGTGRIALPLAERGLAVSGIDLAPAMLERLAGKPGGDAIPTVLGDFADVAVEGEFDLVFIVWNSFFNLLTQEDQLRCFENVARRLAPGGAFVIEAYVPAYLHRLKDHQEVKVEAIGVDHAGVGLLRHDPHAQTIEQTHIVMTADGTHMTPVVQRYCWPSELDLMARAARLRLEARYADWHEAPFGRDSAAHVSVWRR